MGAGSFHRGTSAYTSLAGAADAVRELVAEQIGSGQLGALVADESVYPDIDAAEADCDAWFTFTEEDNIDEATAFYETLAVYAENWPEEAEGIRTVIASASGATADQAEREDLEDTTTILEETTKESAEDLREAGEGAGGAAAGFFSDWRGPAALAVSALAVLGIVISVQLQGGQSR